ncbi:MBL fold metallo-hydrolase [Pontibacter sp. H249]|uniref:MBL fold metallo-hydrolase n=1 Tax=Pontibacter sp. H249 TaxID=3133420 RepID=UPI0030C20020
MKKFIKLTLYVLGVIIIAIIAGCSLTKFAPQFGDEATGQRLETILQSPNFRNREFQNPVETNMDLGFKEGIKAITSRLFGVEDDLTPAYTIAALKLDSSKLAAAQDTATVITWLGHSAFLVEIDGKRLLLDPMLGERASPFGFMGPKRFSELPITLEALPKIDAVLISHDHYDHLDHTSIKQLEEKTTHFFVPLGVGAHLERWGVPASKITELDWWQEATFNGLTFASTPSRHFSGRSLSDRMQTLWTSWVIRGSRDRIFFSGDSGYFDGFKEIGEKYGPFDITLMENGQYNELWSNIHMMPEQAVQAHIDLKGKLLMPIHWGTFALALHSWNEPIERITAKAKELQVPITTPRIGEPVILHRKAPQQEWWLEYVEK